MLLPAGRRSGPLGRLPAALAILTGWTLAVIARRNGRPDVVPTCRRGGPFRLAALSLRLLTGG
ncbi:hypothetical protein C8E89_12325 [Mycolicibacterium moriokaense]|uniref:Uncharacterized protein n=1 Tax=Mycolicibacterium moriokaense TaxID=39691 RepID=A0A318H9R1_9MYCO|nr:hypothetical protein C8E89_12325 [Mycolicibacterium moriokaense]